MIQLMYMLYLNIQTDIEIEDQLVHPIVLVILIFST
jgi:hypothetical protein